jgi:hypothetical protein
VDHPKSSTADASREACARSTGETRQNCLLLACGIVIALALPFLLRPARDGTPRGTGPAVSSHSPTTSGQ